MLYPVGFLQAIGESLMQIDFIGPRYIEGDTTPIHFLSLRWVRPQKRQLFFRIHAATTKEVLRILSIVFFEMKLPFPDVIQQDNGSPFRGCIDQKGVVGRYIQWWCYQEVIVVFNAPNSPWNTGSVEGANSVFDRKFWKAHHFSSLDQLDSTLQRFNEAFAVYHGESTQGQQPTQGLRRNPRCLSTLQQPFLFLLRVVRENQYSHHVIEVLNRYIELPSSLKGQYVIVQIHLREQWMMIWQERNDHTTLIRSRQEFKVQTSQILKKKKE